MSSTQAIETEYKTMPRAICTTNCVFFFKFLYVSCVCSVCSACFLQFSTCSICATPLNASYGFPINYRYVLQFGHASFRVFVDSSPTNDIYDLICCPYLLLYFSMLSYMCFICPVCYCFPVYCLCSPWSFYVLPSCFLFVLYFPYRSYMLLFVHKCFYIFLVSI